MIELAGQFAAEHPIVNLVIGGGIILLVIALVVFARPIGRAIHELNLWFMRAGGVADQDPADDRRPRDEP
ncbi:MAG: hypothetical protein WBA97_21335 [Actinophytocola sp.]|uniref:hypothetical protein n=1 Tax=Actinophytocola sp. TaxID=1872138 RepID=UPI003C7952B8